LLLAVPATGAIPAVTDAILAGLGLRLTAGVAGTASAAEGAQGDAERPSYLMSFDPSESGRWALLGRA
jgi:hypothetical protein